GRGQRLEPEPLQVARGADIPWIGNHPASGFMQFAERGALLGYRWSGHSGSSCSSEDGASAAPATAHSVDRSDQVFLADLFVTLPCFRAIERQRRRAAEERDEPPPPHALLLVQGSDPTTSRTSQLHSITLSAIAITPDGMVIPSALAVLRLITNSYLVACITGRAAAFSPLRIRPT